MKVKLIRIFGATFVTAFLVVISMSLTSVETSEETSEEIPWPSAFGTKVYESCWAWRLTGFTVGITGGGATWEWIPGTRETCRGWGGFCYSSGSCQADPPSSPGGGEKKIPAHT